jgi:hypothetical protein
VPASTRPAFCRNDEFAIVTAENLSTSAFGSDRTFFLKLGNAMEGQA